MISYGFTKTLEKSFDETVNIVIEELKKEGFGILSTIDFKKKLKEKLDLDFKKYLILGACNPPSAYEAITVEENIGLMLPCNIIVYEKDNSTVVSIIKPSAAMSMIDNEDLKNVALRIENKLENVINALG